MMAVTLFYSSDVTLLVVILLYGVMGLAAADTGSSCTTGGLVGAVLGTFFGTLALCCFAAFLVYHLRIRQMIDKVKGKLCMSFSLSLVVRPTSN